MKKRSTNKNRARQVSGNGKAPLTSKTVLSPGAASAWAEKKLNPKWAWHWRTLLALRDRLLTERGLRRTEAAQAVEPHSMDMADSATDEFDHDLVLSALSAEQDILCEVDEALKRIVNGTYGACEETGKPIPVARLRAIPWARFGAEVEARLEEKGVVRKPGLGRLGSVRKRLKGGLEENVSEEEDDEPVKAAAGSVAASRERSSKRSWRKGA